MYILKFYLDELSADLSDCSVTTALLECKEELSEIVLSLHSPICSSKFCFSFEFLVISCFEVSLLDWRGSWKCAPGTIVSAEIAEASTLGGGENDKPALLPIDPPWSDVEAASAAVSSPLSSCLSSLKRAAASRIRLNSMQNAWTSINSSWTLIILFRMSDWRNTHSNRT